MTTETTANPSVVQPAAPSYMLPDANTAIWGIWQIWALTRAVSARIDVMVENEEGVEGAPGDEISRLLGIIEKQCESLVDEIEQDAEWTAAH
jgi:hypothetical protein